MIYTNVNIDRTIHNGFSLARVCQLNQMILLQNESETANCDENANFLKSPNLKFAKVAFRFYFNKLFVNQKPVLISIMWPTVILPNGDHLDYI